MKTALIIVAIPDDMTDGQAMVVLPRSVAAFSAAWISPELVRDETAYAAAVESFLRDADTGTEPK